MDATLDSQIDTDVQLFTERATPLGSIVERVADSAALATLVREAASSDGEPAVSVSRPVADVAPEFVTALTAAGVTVAVVQGPDDARDKPVGISIAHRAIAETGSALLDERHLQDRASSLMTLHNIVIIRTQDLLPSLDSTPELLREIARRGPGGYASFMTGPSRTADIEMSLTVGVQGPGQITMVFVDSLT
ncbi:MAG: lactate utilization protein [Chloroflexota bacterium]|nr:lactate utilization protein [Chloroflexota bacterium]